MTTPLLTLSAFTIVPAAPGTTLVYAVKFPEQRRWCLRQGLDVIAWRITEHSVAAITPFGDQHPMMDGSGPLGYFHEDTGYSLNLGRFLTEGEALSAYGLT